MIFPHPNKVIRRLYPDALWRVNTNKKELYLTIDDGPTPSITENVLSILEEYNAKATFFCLGTNANRNPEIIELIQNSGHTIGNHSYSHPKGSKTKNSDYFKDIEKADSSIRSKLFRPPYGSLKRSQYRFLKEKYTIVFWDVMAYDFHPKINADKCFRIIKKFSKSGSIIVFHDNKKAAETMIPALENTLEYFSNKGYTFEKL